MTWELIWKIVFIALFAAFAIMAILVTVLGARDVRKLIRGLKDDENKEG